MLRLHEERLAWKEVDGETLLLDLETSLYLSVNPSATVLWRLLAEGSTRDALIQALRDAYELDEARATEDVDAFLADCRARKFLVDDQE
jgi:hypothetical protein